MNRPLGVTLVAIVAWLVGFFQIIGAIFGILGGLLITPSALLAWISLVVGVGNHVPQDPKPEPPLGLHRPGNPLRQLTGAHDHHVPQVKPSSPNAPPG
jgi:uncharacterized membrane protein YphA (DoxX/SURF4 family)